MKNFLLYTMLLVLGFYVVSCKKEETKINPNPAIEFVSINKTVFKQFEDSVIIEITYTDGNGDIGFEDADLNSLFVRDSRLSKADGFYVSPKAPLDSSIPIQGKLSIVLPPLFLLGNGNSESTKFEIQLMDREKNMSNIVFSPEVSIVK